MLNNVFQDLSSTQSEAQPLPGVIASAETIQPKQFMTYVSGTISIATIIPPIEATHMLTLIFTDVDDGPGVMSTTGNIRVVIGPIAYAPTVMIYDPVGKWYYGGGLAGANAPV